MRTFTREQRPRPATAAVGRPNAAAHFDSPGAQTTSAAHFAHDFSQIPVGSQATGDSLPFLNSIQQSFGRYDVSQVRARTDSRGAAEALSLGADAFTRGNEVTFSRKPSLHTAAHEAAHVIQQRAGVQVAGEGTLERQADAVADRVVRGQSSEALLDAVPASLSNPGAAPVVQMVRIPPNVRTLLITSTGMEGANFAANVEGAERLIQLAMGELTSAERTTVETNRRGGLPEDQFNALSRRERVSRTAAAIRALFPARTLGDPNLIDTGPRPLTADAAHITTVVGHANTIFTAIASGAQDISLTQVFGAANVGAAKTKYAAGRTAMNTIHAADRIVTDRSGYAGQVSQGGLTDPPGTTDQKIRVEPSVIDSPDNNNSITTLIHESLHAGNSDVSDDVYITASGFKNQPDAKKIKNSAHFEVVPWRILDPSNANAFPVVPATVPPTFQTFIPAGTTVGGVTAPARTIAEDGVVAAYNLMREAWTTGLNMHLFYVKLFKTPTQWTVPQADFSGKRFDNSLPFWSKVKKLTIHRKTTINPASPDEAKHPVSQIDVALSEALIKKLGAGMDVLDPLHTDAQIKSFETAKSSVAERNAAFPGGVHTIDKERDFLLNLAVRQPTVQPMTGSVARDLRVVRQMGLLNWGTVLDPRNPSTFAD